MVQYVKNIIAVNLKPAAHGNGEFSESFCKSQFLIYFLSTLQTPSQRCIINNTHRLVELCVAKLSQDWFPLLELLAMATNPHCKFHIYNGTRPSETVPAGAQLADDELFARPPDPRSPKVNESPLQQLIQLYFIFGLVVD